MIGQDDVIFSDEGDMVVHEDSIQSSTLSQDELAILQASKEAARLVQDLKREVTPNRVAMAGIILLLLIGALFSGWYWVIPRDSVTVETLYIQRGGHIIMSEIHNTGSRDITDVSMDVKFQSMDGEVIEMMSIEVEQISSHSSVAGDDLEMQILGYTVWDSYVIAIEVRWTDYEGDLNRIIQTHEVGEWAWEEFKDRD